jgi:hypothetical protein
LKVLLLGFTASYKGVKQRRMEGDGKPGRTGLASPWSR